MANLSHLSEGEMKEILMLQERLTLLDTQHKAKDSFMEYIRYIWPGFIEGDHHRIIAEKLTRVAKGELKRLIVNMPPRHTKSEFASIYFPSWVMGLNPDMKIMQTTHTADLSINFGRKVRNLMDSDEYSNIFSKVSLASDSKSAGKWQTSQGGEYFAAGVGGAIAGRGADLLIIDDPHSEQDAMSISGLQFLDEHTVAFVRGPKAGANALAATAGAPPFATWLAGAHVPTPQLLMNESMLAVSPRGVLFARAEGTGTALWEMAVRSVVGDGGTRPRPRRLFGVSKGRLGGFAWRGSRTASQRKNGSAWAHPGTSDPRPRISWAPNNLCRKPCV